MRRSWGASGCKAPARARPCWTTCSATCWRRLASVHAPPSPSWHPGSIPHDHDLPMIMATAVELLHIATLVHDDTVDNSDVRRGKATVSSRWGRNIAVLVGDYLFATSATFVCDTKNVRVIRRFSETIMELSRGELSEIFAAYNFTADRDPTGRGYTRRPPRSSPRRPSRAPSSAAGRRAWCSR